MKKEDGIAALKIARSAIGLWIKEGRRLKPKDVPKPFSEKSGVFVTLFSFPGHELRGCIGYPDPVQPLINALIDSAINAAARDPRFPAIQAEELSRVVIHVSILTPPEPIEAGHPADCPKKIRLGRDGLIVESGFCRGLLLPEVATEHHMDAEEFLSHTCIKAGLHPDSWRHDGELRVYKFQTQIFKEKEPGKA